MENGFFAVMGDIMKKIVGFILGITMLISMLQLSIQVAAYAKAKLFEGGVNITTDSDNKKDSTKDNEVLKENNDISNGMAQPMAVLNQSEKRCVGIRQLPSSKAKIIGIVYGSLIGVKVLQIKNGCAYIETVDYNTGRKVRGYVGQAMIKTRLPQKPYYVVTDISDQKVYVYRDGVKIKEMLCSTGIVNSSTPMGSYLIGERGKSFYSSKYREGGYNWMRFNNGYLFHSVPFDSKKRIISSEEKKLGQKASHGCIRLSIGDSVWLYNTIPKGTAILVHE